MSDEPARLVYSSFAELIIGALIHVEHFEPSADDALAELRAACDHVFIESASGAMLDVVAIVDATRDPSRRFSLTVKDLERIGKKAAETAPSQRVRFAIIEIREHVSKEDFARLALIKPSLFNRGATFDALAVDTTAMTVKSSVKHSAREERLRWMLQNPNEAAVIAAHPDQLSALTADAPPAEAPPAAPAISDRHETPIVTYSIIGLIAAIFFAQLFTRRPLNANNTVPSVTDLIAFGGLSRPLVIDDGEWFRMLTASLLHASPVHLLLNAVSLLMAGNVVEHMLGRVWLVVIFFLSALGGSALSLLINDPSIVSVGASGAIMGVLAAAFMSAFRLEPNARAQVMTPLAQILIPSLLPIFAVRTGENVDYANPFGGAIMGALAGLYLFKTWPVDEPRPRVTLWAKALVVLTILGYSWSAYQARATYDEFADIDQLAPEEELPEQVSEAITQVDDLLRRYPNDPRMHYYKALEILQKDPTAFQPAIAQLRIATSSPVLGNFDETFVQSMKATLGALLFDAGNIDEARNTLREICPPSADLVEHHPSVAELCAEIGLASRH